MPRPLWGGWPVPWSSQVDTETRKGVTRHRVRFSDPDDDRLWQAREEGLCLVCGDPLAQTEEVVVFLNRHAHTPMDGGAVHPRCGRLARRWCPALRPDQTFSVAARIMPLEVWQKARSGPPGRPMNRLGRAW